MRIVIPRQDLSIPTERGQSRIWLEAGRRYVMSDVEAASGRRAELVDDEPVQGGPPPYEAARFHGRRLVVPFIGGLGDAVALLPVLASLHDRHHDLAIEVVAPTLAAELFSLSPIVERVHAHALVESTWRTFEAYLPLERITASGLGTERGLSAAFAEALGIEITRRWHPLRLPPVGERDGGPVAAIAVGDETSLRPIPLPTLVTLVDRLADAGVACVLLGRYSPEWELPSRPELLDLRGLTPSLAQLASALRLADVVVSHDSFLLHLAGALERPTIGVFAPTHAGIALDYRSVRPIASDLGCAPCHEPGRTCPMGHVRCIAWDASVVSGERLARAALERLEQVGAAPSCDVVITG